MSWIPFILLVLWGGFGASDGLQMQGGTVLKDASLYSHVVQISQGTPPKGKFKCLGVILSALMVYTSNYCLLTIHNKDDHFVDASFTDSDPSKTLGKIAYVYPGMHQNDFAQVTLDLPGLMIPLPAGPPAKILRVYAFQDFRDYFADALDGGNITLVALALDEPDFKGGAVTIIQNDTECNELYEKARKKEPTMPVNMTDHLMCAVEAAKPTTYTTLVSQDVAPGMPCDTSVGSPVMGVNCTVGMIVKAFCDGGLRVAFIQPILFPETGLKPDVPDGPLPPLTTEGIYTGTWKPVTGLSPPRTRAVPTEYTEPANLGSRVVNRLVLLVLGGRLWTLFLSL